MPELSKFSKETSFVTCENMWRTTDVKFGCNRSIVKNTGIEGKCTFSSLFRHSWEEFS